MPTARLTIRLPRELAARLSAVARDAGFRSGCDLARAMLTQFIRNREAVADVRTRQADWIADMAERLYDEADRHDPTHRKNINERL